MDRIRKAYAAQLRALLVRLNARRPDAGVAWFESAAGYPGSSGPVTFSRAMERLLGRLQSQRARYLKRRGINRPDAPPRRFSCDAGLGGLARWLRASGYDAGWVPDIDDAELIRQAARSKSTVLTTDSLMMERGVLRDGSILSLWVPPTIKAEEQLERVFRDLNLTLREPRCMKCGGELCSVEKKSVKERIPPKTGRWLDEYFQCGRCGQLFWRGTHWREIIRKLERLGVGTPSR